MMTERRLRRRRVRMYGRTPPPPANKGKLLKQPCIYDKKAFYSSKRQTHTHTQGKYIKNVLCIRRDFKNGNVFDNFAKAFPVFFTAPASSKFRIIFMYYFIKLTYRDTFLWYYYDIQTMSDVRQRCRMMPPMQGRCYWLEDLAGARCAWTAEGEVGGSIVNVCYVCSNKLLAVKQCPDRKYRFLRAKNCIKNSNKFLLSHYNSKTRDYLFSFIGWA